MTAGKVFSIRSGVRFLPTLVDALLDGRLVGPIGADPLALARTTIYLPTQRATRALSTVLSARLGPALLPRMIPLGEVDEAEFDLAASPLFGEAADVLRPPMAPLQRRLILARLVQRWAIEVDRHLLPLDADVPFLVPSSPSDAIGLAGDLERLMDALTVEGVPWSELASAVEAEQSRFFALTLDFLRIAAENWPTILEERAVSDPVARARLLLLAEAERLRRERPDDPVVVAGSTGSRLPTAALIAAVAGLPRGAVVLPGLDTDLDAEGWAAIEPSEIEHTAAHGHPQAVLHALLGPRCLGLAREDVVELGVPNVLARARTRLLSQALRPAETTDSWARIEPAERAETAGDGLSGLAIAQTTDEREEALVVAIALRETLERPGATAALVTPDRGLAMRVAAELARWGIRAEDSAGTSLARSQAGRFARLAAELAVDVRPALVIALLSHPYVRLGLPRGDVVRGAAALEIGALRGLKPRPGFAGLRASLEAQRRSEKRAPRPKRRLLPVDWDLAATVLDRLEAVFGDFACDEIACNLVALAAQHRATCDRLLDGPDPAADHDPSLACLDALFDDLDLAQDEVLPGRTADYPAFFTALTRERVVAGGAAAAHPRVRILGLLEARLLDVDRVVLGGLDEGIWPMRTTTDAFLSRPMRGAVGLTPPERRIGQSAHDFVQALGCRDAVITRAGKRDGAPTVPSRFLQRIKAFAGTVSWDAALAAGERLRGHAAALDKGLEPAPPRLSQPKPKADPALFPRKLSVTEIETLVRDPYSIFARHVLGLDPLDAVALVPGASDRGTLVHDVLGKFAAAYPEQIADLAAARTSLAQLAEDAFAWIKSDHPEIFAEWFPRYQRLAAAFLEWEQARRPELVRIHPEIYGRYDLRVGVETITLTGVADRIELGADGGVRILDFKTGTPPTNKVVFAGFSPQLTLEAAMLMQGAFKGLTASATPELIYIHASGGREPFRPIPLAPAKEESRTVEAIVEDHLRRLRGLIARHLAGEAVYTSRPYAQYASRFGAYDHLARVLEWSLADAPEAE